MAAKRDDTENSGKFHNGLLNQIKADLRHLVNQLRLFLNLDWTLKCTTSCEVVQGFCTDPRDAADHDNQVPQPLLLTSLQGFLILHE